jgi:hypothetical protein
MKTPQPFCCDITSGTKEEQDEFKRLYVKAMNRSFGFVMRYYGVSKIGNVIREDFSIDIQRDIPILPLSEGIAILKQMVGEETKQPTDLKVVRDRIVEAVGKSCSYEDGQIYDIDMIQLKERIDGILDSLQPKPNP